MVAVAITVPGVAPAVAIGVGIAVAGGELGITVAVEAGGL